MGDVGSNMVWATLTSFMTFFFTDIAGIGAAIVGTILLVSRFLDAFSDVGMGIIVDRTNTKHGKARPWLLWVAVPYGIGAVLLFTVPDFSMTGKIIYAFLTYNLMSTILYTIYNMPYGTLTALITQDQYERSIITMMRMAAGVITAIVLNNTTLPLVNHFGGGARGWQMTNVVYGALAAVFILLCFFNTKERVKPVTPQRIPVKEGLKALLANKYWQMILVVGVLVFMLFALPAVNIYYARYVLGNPMYMGIIMTCNFLPNLAGFILMTPLVKKMGKRNTVFIGFVFYAIGTLVLIANPLNLTHILTGTVIKGLGFAPIVGTLYAFVADTIEYGEWKTGVRNEGLLYSAASFGQKVGTGLALALIGWMLDWGGYVANAAIQSVAALQVISALFIYVPLLLYFLIVFVLWFYKLDQEYPRIVEELRQRRS